MTDISRLIKTFVITLGAAPVLLSPVKSLSSDFSFFAQTLHDWVLVNPFFV
jgi:hypothetical protein